MYVPPCGKSRFRMAAVTALVAMMFLSVFTVCPAVSDWAEADPEEEVIEYYEGAVPDEVLEQLIAEELVKVEQLDDALMQEQFGVSKDEYVESVEALGGQSLMLVGDEEGNVHVETFDPIERGYTGMRYEGDHIFFGIDSFSWGAIKWWFSNECINMILDQMCGGEIDAIGIAENELRSIADTISSLEGQLSALEGSLNAIAAKIRGYENDSVRDASNAIAAYEESVAAAEESVRLSEESLESNGNSIAEATGSVEFLRSISGEDVVDPDEHTILAITSGVGIGSLALYAVEKEKSDLIDKGSEHFTALCIIGFFLSGDTVGAKTLADEMIRDYGKSFVINTISGNLNKVIGELLDDIAKFKTERAEILQHFEEKKAAVESRKASFNEAKEKLSMAEKNHDDAEDRLRESEKNQKNAQSKYDVAKIDYYDTEVQFMETEKKFYVGEVSEDHYLNEKAKLGMKRSELKALEGELNVSKKAVDDAKILAEEAKGSVETHKKAVASERLQVMNEKKELKAIKITSMKHDLDLLKIGKKAAAKATAKASAKAAICGTGIGAVLVVILDVVMAVLVKYIEDHLDSEGRDTLGGHGVVLKVKMFNTHTVDKTIKVLWKKVRIHLSVKVPCFPSLDGVYAQ